MSGPTPRQKCGAGASSSEPGRDAGRVRRESQAKGGRLSGGMLIEASILARLLKLQLLTLDASVLLLPAGLSSSTPPIAPSPERRDPTEPKRRRSSTSRGSRLVDATRCIDEATEFLASARQNGRGSTAGGSIRKQVTGPRPACCAAASRRAGRGLHPRHPQASRPVSTARVPSPAAPVPFQLLLRRNGCRPEYGRPHHPYAARHLPPTHFPPSHSSDTKRKQPPARMSPEHWPRRDCHLPMGGLRAIARNSSDPCFAIGCAVRKALSGFFPKAPTGVEPVYWVLQTHA